MGEKLTTHPTHGETFHLANEVLVIEVHDGLHEILNTFSCKGNSTERQVSGAACCI